MKLSAVDLELFANRLTGVAEEMGVVLQSSSMSPNIKERRDFSCALFDSHGSMVAHAAHIPVHLGSTPLAVRAALARCTFGPGDVVILNDPYAGGTHLPDVTLVAPVFLPGAKKPFATVADRAHHADIGGGKPGSMALATDIHQEGLRIPPVHLVRGGEWVHETRELFLANTRVAGVARAFGRAIARGTLVAPLRTRSFGNAPASLVSHRRESRERAARVLTKPVRQVSSLANGARRGTQEIRTRAYQRQAHRTLRESGDHDPCSEERAPGASHAPVRAALGEIGSRAGRVLSRGASGRSRRRDGGRDQSQVRSRRRAGADTGRAVAAQRPSPSARRTAPRAPAVHAGRV